MNTLEPALHTLADDGSSILARADLADRVLARARQRSRRRSALAIVSAAAVAALVIVGVTTVGQPTSSRHQTIPGPAASVAGFAKPRMNVLLIGTDAGSGQTGVQPDTVIVASIDTRSGATTLFGLPRNLPGVPFPPGSAQAAAWPHGFSCPSVGAQPCLLNTVWTWAENAGARLYPGDPDAGLHATTQVVEQITGLTVDDTVVVNLKGMAELVDAVGGVEVTVHQRLPIGGSAEHPEATSWLEKGRHHLDGLQALWFARSRWSTDDYDRMKRQQCLLDALVQQVDTRTLLTRYPQIVRALGGNLRTSIAAAELPRWAELATTMRRAEPRYIVLVPQNHANPDYPALRALVTAALQPARSKATARTSATGNQQLGSDQSWSMSSTGC